MSQPAPGHNGAVAWLFYNYLLVVAYCSVSPTEWLASLIVRARVDQTSTIPPPPLPPTPPPTPPLLPQVKGLAPCQQRWQTTADNSIVLCWWYPLIQKCRLHLTNDLLVRHQGLKTYALKQYLLMLHGGRMLHDNFLTYVATKLCSRFSCMPAMWKRSVAVPLAREVQH